jgi:hypothetical protein
MRLVIPLTDGRWLRRSRLQRVGLRTRDGAEAQQTLRRAFKPSEPGGGFPSAKPSPGGRPACEVVPSFKVEWTIQPGQPTTETEIWAERKAGRQFDGPPHPGLYQQGQEPCYAGVQ